VKKRSGTALSCDRARQSKRNKEKRRRNSGTDETQSNREIQKRRKRSLSSLSSLSLSVEYVHKKRTSALLSQIPTAGAV
jgi:hypothetical protein